VRILNVCDERQAELARRRAQISWRIAAQRAQLERGLQQLRRPLRIVDKSIQVGAGLREHAGAVTIVLLPVLFLARRLLRRGVGLAMNLTSRAGRWWALWKFGRQAFLSLRNARRGG